MSAPLHLRDVDRRFYADRLRTFLPPRLIDVHTHVWLDAFALPENPADAGRTVTWPARVARQGPIEDLEATYRLLFPLQRVTPLIFATIRTDLDRNNAYCAECAMTHDCRALIFSDPSWSGAEFERRIRAGGFVGAKSYLTMAPSYLPGDEVRIHDYFPPHQLEVLDAHGWIAMVHIPRSRRLRDPVNLAQLRDIDRRWPKLRCIVAHVGRAYCNEDVGDAMGLLARTENLLFDFSANTNAWVFEQLIRAVGPRRILFGSDLPITRMRMRRVCEGGRYINIVPRGLYGDVSGDPNMREADGADADALSLFLYEQIDAFRCAAEATGLDTSDIAAVFHDNAARLPGFTGA